MIKQLYFNSILHKSFVCTHFKCQTVLFNSQIEPNQVLPLRAKVIQGVMAMKGYSAFPKALVLPETDHEMWRVSYSSAEKQTVYSTIPADWAY